MAHALSLARRRGTRPRGLPAAADGCRLCERAAGRRTRRVRHPRLALRCLPDGQRSAVAHRPVRSTRSTASAASTRRRSARGRRLDAVELLPAREFSLAPDSIREFRRRFRTRFEGDLTRMPLYRDVGDGLAPAGIEYYLPLFFDATAIAVRLPARRRRRSRCRRIAVAGCSTQPGRRSRNATRNGATTSSTRCSIRPRSSCRRRVAGRDGAPTTLLLGGQLRRRRRTRHAVRGRHMPATAAARRCAWTSATSADDPRIRGAPRDSSPERVLLAAESPAAASCCSTCCARTASARVSSRAGRSSLPCRRTARPWPSRRSPPASRSRDPRGHDLRRGAALRRARAPGAPPAPHRTAIRRASSSNSRTCVPAHPSCTRTTASAATCGLTTHGRRRHDRRVPGARIRRRRQALRARAVARADQPLHRRAAPRPRRCTSSAATSGSKARSAPRPGSATPPRSCSTSTRGAPRARATRSRVDEQQLRAFEPGFRSRRRPTRPSAIEQVIEDLRSPQADGPRGLRRRRLRQDRSGAARRLRRRAGRQAGRRAGADDAARAAALPDVLRPLRRLAGQASNCCRASAAATASEGGARRASRTARSTSSSARTACCSRACDSRTWASSSSTRSIASASATRSG